MEYTDGKALHYQTTKCISSHPIIEKGEFRRTHLYL